MAKIRVQGDIPEPIMVEVEKRKPSSKPVDWAKPGCKDCNGRGVVGQQTVTVKGNNTVKQELLCSCARKNYRAWVAKTAEIVKAEMLAKEGKEPASDTQPDQSQERIQRWLDGRLTVIEDNIDDQKIIIAKADADIAGLPHHQKLTELAEALAQSRVALDQMIQTEQEYVVRSKQVEDEIAVLSENIEKLRQKGQALVLERQQFADGPLTQKREQIQQYLAEQEATEKDLIRKSHPARHCKHVAMKRIDKLQERRQRAIREAGLDPVAYIETKLAPETL